MVSLRATIAALASAGVLAMGCGGDSKSVPIPAATLEQQIAQLQTSEGRKEFLLKTAQKGLINDVGILWQALSFAMLNDRYTVEKILEHKNYTHLLDVDQSMQAARMFTESEGSFDYLKGLDFLIRRGDETRAKQEYDRLVQNPQYASAWGMASHAERFGDYERAVQVLSDKFPDNAADIALRRIGVERALQVYTDAHWYTKALTFAKEHGMPERAQQIVAEGLAFYGEKTELRLEYAELLEASGRIVEADAFRQRIQEERCLGQKDYRCAGFVAEARGRFDEASRFFEMSGEFFKAAGTADKAGQTERARTYRQIAEQLSNQN